MKRSKFTLALIVTVSVLCGIVIGAGATSGMQEIAAYLNANITVKLDGEAQTFLDAKGNRVYPITYQGSTYLPVRAVAGLVGLDVDWDQATQTVLLGQTKGVDLIDTYKNYAFNCDSQGWNGVWQVQTADNQTEDISGVACSHWISLYTRMLNAAKGDVWIAFNLLGKHDTLTFSYYANNDATLTVLGDNGSVLGEYAITGGAIAKTVTIPLLKTSELKFQIEAGTHTDIRIFDAYLDAEG